MIFAGPIAIGVGTCYCIKHGNDAWKALYSFKCDEIQDLMIANNLLTDKAKAMVTGAALAKLDSKTEEEQYEIVSPNYSFSDDPEGEVEDYGKKVLFYDDYCEDWFESTIFDVLMAEEQLHKLISIRGYAALGEFRSLLHLEHEDWMYLDGWDLEVGYKRGQYGWVDFVHSRRFLDDGRVYYMLRYCNSPAFVEEFEYDYGYIKNVRDGS